MELIQPGSTPNDTQHCIVKREPSLPSPQGSSNLLAEATNDNNHGAKADDTMYQIPEQTVSRRVARFPNIGELSKRRKVFGNTGIPTPQEHNYCDV